MRVRHQEEAEGQVVDAQSSRVEPVANSRSYATWGETPPKMEMVRIPNRQMIVVFGILGTIPVVFIGLMAWLNSQMDAMAAAVGVHNTSPFPFALVLPFAPFGVLFAFFGWAASPRVPRRLLQLMAAPSPVTQFSVGLLLRRRGVLYATDTGLVMFVDDSLVYHGVSTEFSFSNGISEDGLRHVMWDPHGMQVWCVRWFEGGDDFQATFQPLTGATAVTRMSLMELSNGFKSWAASIPRTAVNVLPPLEVQEAFRARKSLAVRRWFIAASCLSAVWVMGLCFALASKLSLLAELEAAPALFLTALAVIGTWGAWTHERSTSRKLDRFAKADGTQSSVVP